MGQDKAWLRIGEQTALERVVQAGLDAQVDAVVVVGAPTRPLPPLPEGVVRVDDPADRAARRHTDEALATAIERDGLERFVDDWLAQPLFATLPSERQYRGARLRNRPEGLAASLRSCGT
ncbi:MAG: NTP transferase domain-containing protein, partial [Deltaproteobacteria bacterium]|nr:NTP transferase domain-containing protein [Deltaproteobacteria bacterium]